MKVANLTTEVEHVGDEVMGQGVQAGFKAFCQLMLQLHPDFDMGALKVFVTSKVIKEAITEVEAEVAAACEAVLEDVGTNSGGFGVEAKAPARV